MPAGALPGPEGDAIRCATVPAFRAALRNQTRGGASGVHAPFRGHARLLLASDCTRLTKRREPPLAAIWRAKMRPCHSSSDERIR